MLTFIKYNIILNFLNLKFYFQNLNQNPRTLLPKFFGLYCYRCNSKNVRLVAMNNLLPSAVKLHQKYDLKGSTYKRKVSSTLFHIKYCLSFRISIKLTFFFLTGVSNWKGKVFAYVQRPRLYRTSPGRNLPGGRHLQCSSQNDSTRLSSTREF